MKSIAIFPYSKEVLPIINHIDMLEEVGHINLIAFYTPSFCFRDKRISIVTIEKLEECIKKNDVLWIVESDNARDIGGFIEASIMYAIQYEKEVLWARRENPPEKLKEYPKLTINKDECAWDENNFLDEIFQLKTPVFFVMGISENLLKYDTLLSIKEEFDERKISTWTIGARSIRDFKDVMPFPAFWYNREISMKKKIIMMNHYLKRVEIEKKIDIFLIGIPGGVGMISNKLLNDFGLTVYGMAQAAPPDCGVLALPVDSYSAEELQYCKKRLENQYNVSVDYFNIVNRRLCIGDSERLGKFSYLTVDDTEVENIILQLGKDNVFNLSNKENVKKVVDKIISRLKNYGEISIQ